MRTGGLLHRVLRVNLFTSCFGAVRGGLRMVPVVVEFEMVQVLRCRCRRLVVLRGP